MEFRSLRRRQIEESTNPGLPHPYVPLSGFLNLLAACSSSILAGLFHPADAHGIQPFRAFSSSRAVTPCRRPLPSCRYLPLSARPRYSLGRGARTFVLGSNAQDLAVDFRAFLSCRARAGRGDFTPHVQSMLSWALSSLGSGSLRRWLDLHRDLLPCASGDPSPGREKPPCTPESCSPAVSGVLSRGRRPLLRFLASSRHLGSGFAGPGLPLGLVPPSPVAVAFCEPLREPCRSPP
jgi:hypothetical protein